MSDLEKYTHQTNTRLIIGGLGLVFLIGGGLIYYFYGPGAAAFGLLCAAAGLLPLFLILLALSLMEWIVKRAKRDQE